MQNVCYCWNFPLYHKWNYTIKYNILTFPYFNLRTSSSCVISNAATCRLKRKQKSYKTSTNKGDVKINIIMFQMVWNYWVYIPRYTIHYVLWILFSFNASYIVLDTSTHHIWKRQTKEEGNKGRTKRKPGKERLISALILKSESWA